MKEDVHADDTSSGRFADPRARLEYDLPSSILNKFECYSYRNASTILVNRFPDHAAELFRVLESFRITKRLIRLPGENKSRIAKHLDDLMPEDWPEARISGDLTVLVEPVKKTLRRKFAREISRKGFLDGHRIDFVKGQVAFDLEWNSKDQTFDRDLYAFSTFYAAGAISLGVMLTRANDLDNEFFRSLGTVLKKDGSPGKDAVYKKFGASTTWMGKLLYRLDAGRNGGCPILALGITQDCIDDD